MCRYVVTTSPMPYHPPFPFQSHTVMFRRSFARWVSAADITTKLKASEAISPKSVDVTDISSGCGSFFRVEVIAPSFEGRSLLEQHRLVNAALADEIKQIHGLTIVTKSK